MKRLLIVCAALAAATPLLAKDKKPKAEPPAPPAIAYENDDMKMGDVLDQVCVASPMSVETYDGKDNLAIVEATDGSHAFLHLRGDCNFNSLMFAQSIAPKSGSCLSAGDSIVVTGSFGAPRECSIAQINAWHPERDNLPDTQEEQPY